jgi:hypothetical protein
MPENNIWLEAAIYLGVIALFITIYVAVTKFGIPWYYCKYYAVCIY